MKAYMIVATVDGIDYLTKVSANSESGAEHTVLNLAYCGRHTYGVTACMAYDVNAMKYDTFIYHAINSNPVSFEQLKEIIEDRNAVIRRRDEAEERIYRIEKQMIELKEELEAAKAVLDES